MCSALRNVWFMVLSSWLPRPTGGRGRFLRRDSRVKVTVNLAVGSNVDLQGNVIFKSEMGQRGHTKISVGKGATLRILGDFVIGPEVLIFVGDGAELVIKGKVASSGSGITASTRIMVRERVDIGEDAIIAWDVFITDCDWHTIDGRPHTRATSIGDRVWIANGASVLKGSHIGDDSIIAAHGLCMMNHYPQRSLLGGVPARVLRQDVAWHRELL